MGRLAAGLIIYRLISNQIEYLLLQTSYGEHHFTPPKGHLDAGESYLQAAIRETKEEAGLESGTDYSIADSFQVELKYLVNEKPKTVLYWLAKMNNPNTPIVLSDEHQDFKWLDLTQACAHVKYDDMQKALRQADDFIRANYQDL